MFTIINYLVHLDVSFNSFCKICGRNRNEFLHLEIVSMKTLTHFVFLLISVTFFTLGDYKQESYFFTTTSFEAHVIYFHASFGF